MDAETIMMMRVFERLAMTVVIFSVGIISIIVFAIRRKELGVDSSGMIVSLKTSVSLAMVVFSMLVLYAWANMSNPISVERTLIDRAFPPDDTLLAEDGNASMGVERIVGLGDSQGNVALYARQLAEAYLFETGRTTLSMVEAGRLADLASRLAALRAVDIDFETDLFNRYLSFDEISDVILDAYAEHGL